MRRFPLVEAALQENPNCRVGLMLPKHPQVFYIPKGPYGGEELLTLLYAGDPSERYWYGHVCFHPENRCYAAALVWSKHLINGETTNLLFRRFQYWISIRLCYEPCAVQADDDAFFLGATFEDAVGGLVNIIHRFSVRDRWPLEDRAFDRTEYRIFSLYGLRDSRDRDGCFPPIPAEPRTSLTLVGGWDYD
ncbi:MAG: hypothetical protein LDL44_04635 [Caenispirillum sp.]|nr:hypothetical protein [Caenispirillum sp.]